jgi:2-dehydro-3-deoxyglucarate aldolase/4-hydroxy-2-oxoheptanedioate aldolase
MKESFRTRLKRGETLLGSLLTLPSPEIAEILAMTGLDWLFIDLEHSTMEVRDAQGILQAVAGRVECLLRLPLNDEIWIKKALDTGAAGIILPQVNTVEEARRAVQLSCYPPLGSRSVGLARAQGYGMKFQEYLDQANKEVVVVIQAEHILAVQNIEALVRVEGIDAVLVGPYDLSASMGLAGQVDHPEVQAAIEQVRGACRESGMPLGVFATTAQRASQFLSQGFSLLAVGSDALFLSQAAGSAVQHLRELGKGGR